jgi:acetolactate synthase-1/2/3 large subunit
VLTPTDYNAMGFAVPAAVAAALEYPDRQVVAVVGDGGLLMTGVELLTARRAGRKVIVLCFHDGALGLIKLMQKTLYRRAAAVDLPALDLEAFARFVGADYVPLGSDLEIDAGLARALAATKSVIVDARVKYDAPTRYFKAVALANAKRMPVAQTLRIGARILRRAVLPGKDL